jgi:hypothetical protein
MKRAVLWVVAPCSLIEVCRRFIGACWVYHHDLYCGGNFEFLQLHPAVAADALPQIGTAVVSAVMSLYEHLSQAYTFCVPKFCYQSVHCLIWYFFMRTLISKCFINSRKLFRCKVMFKNENTFCSWIHHFRYCTVLAKRLCRRPSNQGDLDLSVTGEVGRAYSMGLDLLMIVFLYRSMWLLFGWVVNGTHCSSGRDDHSSWYPFR